MVFKLTRQFWASQNEFVIIRAKTLSDAQFFFPDSNASLLYGFLGLCYEVIDNEDIDDEESADEDIDN